jgi:hypothetical protein
MKTKTYAAFAAALSMAVSTQAIACTGCGCTLNTDDATIDSGAGWRIDERLDFIDQSRLQIGGKDAPTQDPTSVEVEKRTATLFYTTTLDYQAEGPWGFNLAVPMQYRFHSTANNGTDFSQTKSNWNDLSDIRVQGRYTGLLEDRSLGIQGGLKVPSGRTTENFRSGDNAGTQVDRGLQPGTGTWDVLLGMYKNGHLTEDTHWFASIQWQRPLGQYNDFAEGQKLTGTVGVRYVFNDLLAPQLQINAQNRWRDEGALATPENSGGQVIYISPGLFVNVRDDTSLYAFVQLPVFQRVGGLELVADYSASVGLKHKF